MMNTGARPLSASWSAPSILLWGCPGSGGGSDIRNLGLTPRTTKNGERTATQRVLADSMYNINTRFLLISENLAYFGDLQLATIWW
jgi:hypothetical protein